MSYLGSLPAVVEVLVAMVTAGLVVTKMVERFVHRRDLAQARYDWYRLTRLHRRLTGSVTAVEYMLRGGLAPAPVGFVTEELAPYPTYLYAIRDEAEVFAARARRHNRELRWPRGYALPAGLTARRCTAAHDALATAADALAVSAREFEEALAQRCKARRRGPIPRSARLDGALSLLTPDRADRLAELRRGCEDAMREAAGHLRTGRPSDEDYYRCPWPVYRSELAEDPASAYAGEFRPLSWAGLGPTPLVHVNAQ